MTFDWSKAFTSLIPIGIFCVMLFLFSFYAEFLLWLEDRVGIPVMFSITFTVLVVFFILSGLVVV